MIPVTRLNHAVLYVNDVERSVAFYKEAFGFEVAVQFPGAAFLRAAGSSNDHDLGLFQRPRQGERDTALYHLAWEVPSVTDLVSARDDLVRLGALVGASDHGVSKSLYAVDPDGNEFEIMWAVPADQRPDDVFTRPLDLEAEVARFGPA
jgi:catechol-2,3-dioxygenase